MSFLGKLFRDSKTKNVLKTFPVLFKTIETLEKKGAIIYDGKQGRVFIESYLAYYFFSLREDGFKNFIRNVCLYHSFLGAQMAYDEAVNNHLKDLVREAVGKGEVIDDVKLNRLRLMARDRLQIEEPETFQVKEIEFFIIQNDTQSDEVIWVGTYNTDTDIINIASWEQIQRSLSYSKETDSHGKE